MPDGGRINIVMIRGLLQKVKDILTGVEVSNVCHIIRLQCWGAKIRRGTYLREVGNEFFIKVSLG